MLRLVITTHMSHSFIAAVMELVKFLPRRIVIVLSGASSKQALQIEQKRGGHFSGPRHHGAYLLGKHEQQREALVSLF